MAEIETERVDLAPEADVPASGNASATSSLPMPGLSKAIDVHPFARFPVRRTLRARGATDRDVRY